jgi:TRAP-type C4-dicarboxylate transport system substrate-binding protein
MRALRFLPVVALLLGFQATAQPVKVRIGYFLPASTTIHQHVFVPLAEGLNKESGGRIEATLHPGGELGANPTQQLELLQDGKIDISFLVPNYSPKDFPDHEIMQLATGVADTRSANLVHQRLNQRGLLRVPDRVKLLAAVTDPALELHTKFPFEGLDSLKGRTIRASIGVPSEYLAALGAKPADVGHIGQAAEALRSGTVEGTLASWPPALNFGLIDVTTHHVGLGLGYLGLAVAMNKAKYESLPADLKQVVDRFSGEWIALRFAESGEMAEQRARTAVSGLEGHKIVELDADQRAQMREKLEPVVTRWAQGHPNGEAIVAAMREESRKLKK